MREKKNYPPSKKCPVLLSAQFSATLDSYFIIFLFKKSDYFCLSSVRVVFSPQGDKRHGISAELEARRVSSNSSQWDACVCASERAQPTGAPLLCNAFSRKRVPASLSSLRTKVRQSYYKFTNKGPSNAAISLPY